MNLQTGKKLEQGSTLVLTVIISALLGSVLCSYLVLVSSRNENSMRALAWNSAIPVLEAGIEEALTHLHEDQSNPGGNHWAPAFVNGQKVFWKKRTLPDGSYYCVTNMNVGSTTPLIFSAGYVPSPLKTNQYISRLVRVTTTNPPSMFHYAIASAGPILMSGSAVVDGYNSGLGPYGAGNRNATGSIATDSQQQGSINVGSAHIYGHAVTGPGGTVAVNGGSVGDLTWNQDIQAGWTNDNMNVSFQSNSPPTGDITSVTTTRVGTSNITYLTGSTAVYKTDTFVSNSTNRPMVVTGHATLWVTGDFTVSGGGYVYIAPGASLNLYVGGRANMSGGGVVNGSGPDGTGLPANFSYFGLSSNSLMQYSGLADLIGTINAPQAAVKITGGASLYGAIICNSFNSNGTSGVHYDQTLAGGGIFLVTSWREFPW